MPRRRTKNPSPITAKTPEDWWLVRYMDVEKHLSKAGNESIRVDYTVDEREFPVSVYFTPDHSNEFARKRWRKFKAEMAEQGHEIKGKSIETIVEMSEDWLQPGRIGVISKDSDDGEFEDIDVVALDWGEYELPPEEGDEDDAPEEKAQPASTGKDDDDLPF